MFLPKTSLKDKEFRYKSQQRVYFPKFKLKAEYRVDSLSERESLPVFLGLGRPFSVAWSSEDRPFYQDVR